MKKVGIVGYGGMGEYHHRLINGFGELELAAVMDISKEALKLAKEKGAPKVTENFNELLSSVDIVLIATPNDSHKFYALSALNSGKHVICEKPASLTVGEYEEMEKAASKNNRILMVHQNRRFDRDFLTVREIIKSGALGRVYKIQSAVMAANGIPGGWRKEKSKGGGMMLDWGVHLIDQAFLIADFEEWDGTLSYVFGHEVEDGFNINLRKKGLVYNIIVDTNAFIPEPRWLVFGTEGTLVINDWDITGKILRIKHDNNNPIAIEAGNGLTKTMAEREKSSIEELPIKKAAVTEYAYHKEFMKALNGQKQFVAHSEVKKVLTVMSELLEKGKILE